ncbi:MAG: hypothetical protein V1721_08420 [Pseudomonadota bacterium]
MNRSLFVVIAVLALAGCNTFFQGSSQKIVIETPGVEDADCILQTEKSKYRVLTPRPVIVERSRLAMTVTCEKVNYFTGVAEVKPGMVVNPGALNFYNGFIPGTAYDVASNSIYAYPDTVTVIMNAKPAVVEAPPAEEPVLQQKAEDTTFAAPPTDAEKAATEESFRKSMQK